MARRDEVDPLPRVLTRAQALSSGLSRHAVDRRLASGRWRRVLPRTYFTGETFTDTDRMTAALAFAGPGSALSGAAALVASEVRRVVMPARVLVLIPPGAFVASHAWVQIRRSTRPIIREDWYGPARVQPARAAADLAVTMTQLDDVRALVARVVQDGHCTLDELVTEWRQGPRRGSAFLRQALEEVGAGAASAPEARAARILTSAGITGFLQNAEVQLPDGSRRVIDFLWPELRACLEIDSVEYHFTREDWARTWDRHLDLTSVGYAVIHRPPSALASPAKFVADVRAFLGGREADLRRGFAG